MSRLSANFQGPIGGAQSPLRDAVLAGNTQALIRLIREWRTSPPDFAATASSLTAGFGFSPRTQNIVQKAVALASEPHNNMYHNNGHFLEVFAVTALLGQRAYAQNSLQQHELGLLLASALIHDYRHDGTMNAPDERYRLERVTLDGVIEPLKLAGADVRDLAIVEALVLSTDVVKEDSNQNDVSPGQSVQIYSHTRNPDDLFPELRALHKYGLAEASLILQDADISCSVIDVELSERSGHMLMGERGKPYTVAGQVFFLDKICNRQLHSKSGTELLQPHMNVVLKHFGLPPRGGSGAAPGAHP